jgi:hypothetical protein
MRARERGTAAKWFGEQMQREAEAIKEARRKAGLPEE